MKVPARRRGNFVFVDNENNFLCLNESPRPKAGKSKGHALMSDFL